MEKKVRTIKTTFEFINDQQHKLDFKTCFTLPDEKFYFFTFKEDNYKNDEVILELYNFLPNYLYATVPENEKDITAVSVILAELNPHIKLIFDYMNYYSDDYLRNRATIRFKFKVLQTA